jgi:hypothetical protein
MLVQASFFAVAAPFLLLFLTPVGLATIAGAISAFAFFKGVGHASENPMLCEVVRPGLRSTAIGIMNMLNCLAGGIGVMAAGMLKPAFGLGGVFGAVSFIMLGAAILLWLGSRRLVESDIVHSRTSTRAV